MGAGLHGGYSSQNTLEWEEAHAFQVVHAVTVTSLLLDIVKAACFH